MLLPVIAEDKANHLIYGGAISLMAFAAAKLVLGRSLAESLCAAALAAAVVAIGKEVYDRQHITAHTPDWLDAVATICGGLAVCAAIALGAI